MTQEQMIAKKVSSGANEKYSIQFLSEILKQKTAAIIKLDLVYHGFATSKQADTFLENI